MQIIPLLCFTLNALIVVFFIALAIKSNLLRDGITNLTVFSQLAAVNPKFTGKPIDEIPRPFSLARTQLGVWTVIIACCYLYKVLCKGCSPTDIMEKNTTTLILLGISAGTTAVAGIIDSSQEKQRHQNQPSEGFIKDILSDENGISIHRFQNVIWTVIAIVIYLTDIATNEKCHLPELDQTLLSLTGISNATYLGLKLKENSGQ